MPLRPPTLPAQTALELEEARRQLATLEKLMDQACDEKARFRLLAEKAEKQLAERLAAFGGRFQPGEAVPRLSSFQ